VFSLIFELTNSRNLKWFVNLLNNLLVFLIDEEVLRVKSTDEWSEFRSRKFFVVWNMLFGILDTKISRISGFLRVDEGQ
jgi:hypothetical protein